MKKCFFALSVLFLGASFWTSCDLFDEDGGTNNGNSDSSLSIVTATETVDETYSSGKTIFEVTPKTKTLNISGLTSGKDVYLAKVNTSSETVGLSKQRTVKTADGYRAALANGGEVSTILEKGVGQKFKHFHGEKITLEDAQNAARSARAATALTEKDQINREVGTTKPIYVDTNVNMNSYSAKGATLRAVGRYCNVWVVDDYYTAGTATKGSPKVDSKIAKDFAKKFDAFYPIVRNVFGNESDNIVYSYSSEKTLKAASAAYPMSSYSDTGKIVNIVLYDIGADYGKSSQCGVLGYFYAKDYYSKTTGSNTVLDYSNQGKYFYIDSAYAVSDFETTVSTLAHEFQHMVNFGMKDMEQGVTPDTAYNEMLSMLCEDMMAEHLDLDDTESVKAERLPHFNTSYFLSGIREYRNDSYAALSYSTSYGFGSWLCRQYGGADLVKAIMANGLADNASLVAAVNEVNKDNNKSYTFDDLFKQFLIACTNGGAKSGYTHNQDASATITYDDYTYPMTAIDLWDTNSEWAYTESNFLVRGQKEAMAGTQTGTNWAGPFLFSTAYGCELRPNYGITLHKIGETAGDTLSLTFSDEGADCITMYVIVQ